MGSNKWEFFEKVNADSGDQIINFLEQRFKKHGSVSISKTEDNMYQFTGKPGAIATHSYTGTIQITPKDNAWGVEISGKIGMAAFGIVALLMIAAFLIGGMVLLERGESGGFMAVVAGIVLAVAARSGIKKAVKVLEIISQDLKKNF